MKTACLTALTEKSQLGDACLTAHVSCQSLQVAPVTVQTYHITSHHRPRTHVRYQYHITGGNPAMRSPLMCIAGGNPFQLRHASPLVTRSADIPSERRQLIFPRRDAWHVPGIPERNHWRVVRGRADRSPVLSGCEWEVRK